MSKTQHQFWGNAKTHLFRGAWRTAREIARLTGVRERTVHYRLAHGMPPDESAHRGPMPKRLAFRGALATIPEIMAATSLSRSTVGKRSDGIRFFEQGEKTDFVAEPPCNARMIFFDGYNRTLSEWSRRVGISRPVLDGRLQRGWSIKDTLTKPLKVKRVNLTYKGETHTISEWAKRLGINRATIADRRNTGWPVEMTLGQEPMRIGARWHRAKKLKRLLSLFAEAPVAKTARDARPRDADPSDASTGGPSPTFPPSRRTGPPRTKHDLHGEYPCR